LGYLAAHGAQKLFSTFDGRALEASAASLDKTGLRPGRPMATLVATSELTGGLLTVAEPCGCGALSSPAGRSRTWPAS
jgi:uncharacterized membrane protein YphA (DoxX/SURF4 family)